MVIGGIVLLLLALILFRYLKHALLWKGFPGLSPFKSLPMVGHAYLFRRNKLEKVLKECRKQHGEIFRLDLGGKPGVILCKYEHIVEAFSQSTFSARPYDDLRAFKDVQGKNKDHKHEQQDEFEDEEEETSVWYIEQGDDEDVDEGDTTSRDTETMSLDSSDSNHVVIKIDDDIVGNYSRGQRKCGHRIAEMRRRRRIRRVANRQAMAGIYWARGNRWQEQRSFMEKNLGEMQICDTVDIIVKEEVESAVSLMAKEMSDNGTVVVRDILMNLVNNLLWRILTGKQTKQTDKEIFHLTKCVKELYKGYHRKGFANNMQLNGAVGYQICKMLGVKTRSAYANNLKQVIRQEVQVTHRDACGFYLQRHLARMGDENAKEGEGKSQSDIRAGSSFRGRDGLTNLHAATLDFIAAGSETTVGLLEWCVLYLCRYPNISKSVRESQDERRKEYIKSTLDEILRHAPGFNRLSPPRAIVKSTVFYGHRLPAGTHIHAHPGSVHMDPDEFGPNPEEFVPDRFLDRDGKFIPSDRLLAFGAGARRCPGARIAISCAQTLLSELTEKFDVVEICHNNSNGSKSHRSLLEDSDDSLRYPAWPRQFTVAMLPWTPA